MKKEDEGEMKFWNSFWNRVVSLELMCVFVQKQLRHFWWFCFNKFKFLAFFECFQIDADSVYDGRGRNGNVFSSSLPVLLWWNSTPEKSHAAECVTWVSSHGEKTKKRLKWPEIFVFAFQLPIHVITSITNQSSNQISAQQFDLNLLKFLSKRIFLSNRF